MPTMTAVAVSQLLYLLNEPFEANEGHSLLGNLRSLALEHWRWVPPDGHRSIRDIVRHIGGCKELYENHAFGDATLTWDHPLVDGGDALSFVSTAIGWLRQGQGRLRRSITALDDAELRRPRMTNWAEAMETR